MKITTTVIALSALSGITSAFAQNADGRPLFNLLGIAQNLVSQAVPLLIGLALVWFFYGLVLYIWKGKEGGESLEKSKQFMMYSIVAIFIMVSIWGIITLIQTTLGISPTTNMSFPSATGQ